MGSDYIFGGKAALVPFRGSGTNFPHETFLLVPRPTKYNIRVHAIEPRIKLDEVGKLDELLFQKR